MKLILLDVDNTIVPFQPTKRLYNNIFLKKKSKKHYLIGLLMLFILKYFWFVTPLVTLQRKIIMTLFSKANQSELEKESHEITNDIIKSYKKTLYNHINTIKNKNDKVFILSHCPSIISKLITKKLTFDGEFSCEVCNYFKDKTKKIPNKYAIMKELKNKFPKSPLYYFADDLIDIKPLLFADTSTLVNASSFTKKITRLLKKDIIIWN
ncbi:hypothetical protein CL658_04805 [bacterium]|nr:hypothetical protein [bacterium]|tara:strand:+ start:1494 stop:2120 length:627 start_codon:yes stop_codon:yes gene_type:complete